MRGREEEALGWYSWLGRPTWIPITSTFPDLRCGEVHEKLGATKKAVESYRRFIEYWRDCDPDLRPMVEDARERLALLEEKK